MSDRRGSRGDEAGDLPPPRATQPVSAPPRPSLARYEYDPASFEARAARALHSAGPPASDPGVRTVGWLVKAKGVFNLLTGLVLALAGFVVFRMLPGIYSESGAVAPSLLVPFFRVPILFPIVCLPAIAGGVWLLATRRWRWTVMAISTLVLVVAAAIVVWAMLIGIAPLYTVRPL